jgi:hypothetical protein
MTVTAYVLMVILITPDEARIAGMRQMESLEACIEAALKINSDKTTYFNAACLPTKLETT